MQKTRLRLGLLKRGWQPGFVHNPEPPYTPLSHTSRTHCTDVPRGMLSGSNDPERLFQRFGNIAGKIA
jgi:hypothetical protein